MTSFAIAVGKGSMFYRQDQRLIGAAMRVMASQATFPARRDSLMVFGKLPGVEFMATHAELGNGLFPLGIMGIMAGAAFTLDRRWMAHAFLPEIVDLMTIDAKGGGRLQQIAFFAIAVGAMANGAVPMRRRRVGADFTFRMTGNAEAVDGSGQQERLIGGMGIVTQRASAFAEGAMAAGFLAFGFDFLVTFGAEGRARGNQQFLLAGAVGVMTGGAIADREGSVQTGTAHVHIDGWMTFAAEGSLILNQNSRELTFMGGVAGHAASFASRSVTDGFGRDRFGMTIETEFFRGFAQQGRLAQGWRMRVMTGQTVALNRRRMGAAFDYGFIGAETIEFVTFETELRRIAFDHSPIIAGMGLVAAGAFAFGRRRMNAGAGEGCLPVGMAPETEPAPLAFDCEGGRVASDMTASAFPFAYRPMGAGAQQPGVIRGMGVVASDTAGRDRVATVAGLKFRPGDLVAALTEGLLVFAEQVRKIRPMGLMAGFTAIGHRFMPIFPAERLPVMTGEADFIPLGLEQRRFGGIVKCVAGIALAVLDRFVRIFQPFEGRAQVTVTLKTKGRFRTVQINPANQPMSAMTGVTFFFLDGQVHNPLAEPLPILGVTVQTRFSDPRAGVPRRASQQGQHAQRQ